MKTSRRDLAPLANIRFSVRGLLSCALALSLQPTPCLDAMPALAAPPAAKDKKVKQDPPLNGLPIAELSADEAILHALNRLAYGPRPGDVDRIKQVGLAKWIDQQLNPASIDDKAVEARLEALPTLRLTSAKLIEEYPRPKQAAKQETKLQQAQFGSDAAAATIARDSQADTDSMSASSKSDSDAGDAPSSMKQPTANVATPGAVQAWSA